ncbi:MAG: DEAD/DEAH box helicase [Ignavibacteria bacterium]|jgi:ATP-dependent RNA helicase DeaD|nr:DEAD/DEAH box helicase [Ignavibacteria bacterium]MCU7502121.1 DEAD/DEAH box helicase [Ignavibacteria bacterium]MCU7515523.1 DEAD/DEAH box helicase [Ignavibacteria bacterium]
MNKRFEELNLSKEIQKAIADLGYEEATPIQSEAIPALLEGHDIIGQAQTGTGKTAAFGIPALEMLDIHNKNIQALILCPTRELALQVSEEISKIAKYKKGFSFLPVYGGQSIERQLNALSRGVHIVIGTPGRVMDHMERGSIRFDNVKMVVLDEADEMLDMGFRDDIELILKHVPTERQTVMVSATMPKPIKDLAKRYQKDPVNIKVVHEVLTVPGIEQIYFEVREKNKLEALTRAVDLYNIKLGLVFCNTKRGVDELTDHLQARGYAADALHGDMKQATREKVMSKFRKGIIEILVATDVAARGLDVENVEAVFNYDMPQDEEYYVHRIGRTGRAGKSGRAFTFVTGRDLYRLKDIQKYTKTKMKLMDVPTFDDVREVKAGIFLDAIRETIKKGGLKKYTRFVEKLIDEETSSLDIASAMMKMSFQSELETQDFVPEERESFSRDEAPREGRSREGRRKEGRKEDKKKKDGRKKENRKLDEFWDESPRREKSKGGNLGKINGPVARLFLNVGKKDKVQPGDIVGAIAGETGLPGKIIGEIDMFDKFSFVNVPEKYVDEIMEVMQDNQIRGKRLSIEVAKDRL